jgi:lipid-binding SYLF domain-containing protein
MTSKKHAIVVMALVAGLVTGCSTGSIPKEDGDALTKRAQASRQEWNKVDPQFEAFAKKGYGFAFFPEITKGGLLVGGAHGQGVVYEKGQHIGYADLTQMSVGFQGGYQDYSQLIVFENQPAMENSNAMRSTLAPTPPRSSRTKAPPWVPSSLTAWRCS